MKRREFIKVVCGLIGAWPIAAYAQQVSRPRRIGVLGSNATIWKPWAAAFVARLQELGWIDGDTAAIEYRWTERSSKRVSEIASEFLRQNVDVIVTYGSAVTVLKQVAAEIPIVFAVAFDPVRGGLVQSMARPGGNITGMSIEQPELIGKRLELLREALPQIRRLAVLADAGYAEPMLEADRVKSTAQALGLEAARLGIWGPQDIAGAFEVLRNKATHFMWSLMHSSPPTAPALSDWRLASDCRLFSVMTITSRPVVSCPMGRTTPIYSAAPPTWSTRFCMGQSPAISLSSSRPSSIWPSI